MEIDIRKVSSYREDYGYREVTIKDGGATIRFDVNNGADLNQFRETMLDEVFGDMEMDEIIKYLTVNGYSDEIIERYEDEKSEAA